MQQGGSQSQYGVSPEITPFTATSHMVGGTDPLQQKSEDATLAVEAASPISSRPPAGARPLGNFEELVPVSGNFPDDDALAGENSERGISGGNRWPRQETLALLKIRSEMDPVFRDATLKAPLWEDVSRNLAELGYIRSAKKCKEKFENVHKYYKRTKEGRAGRHDGKSYRFFNQLEALHSSNTVIPAIMPATITTTTTATITATGMTVNPAAALVPIRAGSGVMVGSSGRNQPQPVAASPIAAAVPTEITVPLIAPSELTGGVVSGSAAATVGVSFSSSTSSSSSDSEDDIDAVPSSTDSRKRKRGLTRSRSSSSSSKMMAFFEGLMKQVMEKQEAMQQRFLETIEKREHDRMIREEAWKRQEMARLSREHEIMAQERAISASRDASVIAFLQQITGQTIQLPPAVPIPVAPAPPSTPTPPPPPPPAPTPAPAPAPAPASASTQPQPQPQPPLLVQQQPQHQQHLQSQNTEIIRHQPVASTGITIAVPEQQHPLAPETRSGGGGGVGGFDPTSSRWPKAEVLALINLRSGLESRYQEAGPKGPLWEEISAGMQRMGYKRNAKRCKEKWENINKYFKKVKESKKIRPEDAKTCPYFHQLDALYQKKILGSSSTGGGGSSSSLSSHNRVQQQQPPPPPLETTIIDANSTTANPQRRDVVAIIRPPPLGQTIESENKKDNNNKNSGQIMTQTDVPTSNGGLPLIFFEQDNSGPGRVGAKPEDIVKELIKQQQQHQRPLQSLMDDYDKLQEDDSDSLDEIEDDEDEDDDEEAEEENGL